MAYWDGTDWVPETPAATPRPPGYRHRLLGAAAEAALVTVLTFGAVAGTALAAKGGGKGPTPKEPTASCQLEGSVVHGSNLPVWELMNFMVTDASGTTGWAIGYTDTGERWINVPEPTAPTRYEFTGRTYGADGSRYDVYASCEAS